MDKSIKKVSAAAQKESRRGALVLLACAAALACAGAARAQEAPKVDLTPEQAAAVAAKALGEAVRMADLLDVAKSERGASPALADALRRAREPAPKPTDAIYGWESGPGGEVRATVASPSLCRALANACMARAPGDPGRCACLPTGGGLFGLAYRLRALPP